MEYIYQVQLSENSRTFPKHRLPLQNFQSNINYMDYALFHTATDSTESLDMI